MNTICPHCERNISDVDGEFLYESRLASDGGDGDVCGDGQLYCIDCLAEDLCPCAEKRKGEKI